MEKKQTRFDAWWATLTPVEQKVIGRTNAKFVWLEACEACLKLCDAKQHYFGYQCAEAIRESIKP